MFRIIINSLLLLTLLLCLTISAALCYTEVSGTYDENTIWTYENAPYHVIGDITVDPDIELVIEKGVEVVFLGTTRYL